MAHVAAVVPAREDRVAADRHRPVELLGQRFLQHHLAAGEGHGRQEVAVGQNLQSFLAAVDADVALDPVVVRRDVGVADRPVHAVAVEAGGLEVVVAHPVRLARPHDRAAADDVALDPVEVGARSLRVGIVDIVDEEVRVDLRAGVAVRLPLAALQEFVAWVRAAAEFHVVRQSVLAEVLLRVEGAARLEHQHVHSGLGQHLGGPASSGARADDDRVVGLRVGGLLHAGWSSAGSSGRPPRSTLRRCRGGRPRPRAPASR